MSRRQRKSSKEGSRRRRTNSTEVLGDGEEAMGEGVDWKEGSRVVSQTYEQATREVGRDEEWNEVW